MPNPGRHVRMLPALCGAALLTLGLAGPAAADPPPDPAGTEPVRLTVGEHALRRAPPAAQAFCDDPAIVLPEMTDAGAKLVAVSPGTTLCVIRDASGLPAGTFRVTVKPARK